MNKTERRIEALENNEKRKKQIFGVVIALLVLTFLGGMVWGGYNIMLTEGAHPPYVKSLSAEPSGKAEILNTFTQLLGKSKDPDATKLKITNWLNVPQDDNYKITVTPDDSEFTAVAALLKADIIEAVSKKYYSEYESDFGGDFSSMLLPVDFTENDISTAGCKLNSDNENNLVLNMVFAPAALPLNENSALYTSFGLQNVQSIYRGVCSDFSDMLTVNSYNAECSGFEITAEYNRFFDTLSYIKYMRRYTIEANVSFTGDYAEIGERTVSFTFEAESTYSFSHAGIVLNMSTLTMEKRATEALQATLTPFDTFAVTWTSSNPEVATVDSDGYVKGVSESSEPVYITASGDFMGRHYEAVCTVYVVTPVEEVRVSPRSLEMKANGVYQLSVHITPEKATIKDVTWYTEDESIAAVDQNGNVTALKPGEVKVYALSNDGYIRSSCQITVTE